MKKLLSFILILLTSFLISCKKEKISELDAYLLNNNLNIEDIEPYLNYNKFNFYDFFDLENLRTSNNYTYLETINYFYCTHNTQALMTNTDLILINKQFLIHKEYYPSLIEIDDYPVKIIKYNMQIQKHVLLNYLNMINDLELFDLYIYSAYRSYDRQEEIYNNSQNKNYVAKPGSSEHQSGLVLDVSTLTHGLTSSFQYSMEYQLLSKYCMNYGFIIRYPENKENITGYYFEPWHLRYVGKTSATYIMNHQLTLEEYLFKNFEL